MKQHPKSLWLLATGTRDSEGSWARRRATGGLPRAILGQVDLGASPEDGRACMGMGELPRGGAGRREPSPGCAEPGRASAS